MENEDIKEETKEEKKLTAKSIFSGNNLKNLIIFAGILGIALIFLSSFMGKKTEETAELKSGEQMMKKQKKQILLFLKRRLRLMIMQKSLRKICQRLSQISMVQERQIFLLQ